MTAGAIDVNADFGQQLSDRSVMLPRTGARRDRIGQHATTTGTAELTDELAIEADRRASARKVSPTRLKVLQVAASLFAARGFNGVGVNEIGEATGLGRGALYYHISSKEDLLYDITTAYMSELIAKGREISASEPDPVVRVQKLSRALMITISEHLSEMTVCFRELHALTAERRLAVTGLHADYHAIWVEALAFGVERGVFKPTPGVVLKGLLGMYFYSFLWLDPRGAQNAAEIGDTFAEIVLKSVRAA